MTHQGFKPQATSLKRARSMGLEASGLRLHFAPRVFALLWLLAVTISCTRSTAPTTTAVDSLITTAATGVAREDPHFYLNLIWHQHQPRYPLLADGSTVSRPWVRVHATKDYYDMAALVSGYPNVKVTFNLTPILLLQLEELANGTKDTYWALTEVPAADLTDEQSQFISSRFFDVNSQIIARFPRFLELAEARDTAFSIDDLRDLQVLFNLAGPTRASSSRNPSLPWSRRARAFPRRTRALYWPSIFGSSLR
jgi:glycosyl hydrolase family 57